MVSPSQPHPDTLAESYRHGSSFVDEETLAKPLRTFLFGYPLAHTMAPLVHEALFRDVGLPWTYNVHETPDASEFLPALKQEDIIGCAVTMPFKSKMLSVVDDVTEEGRLIGAINTVFIRKAVDGSRRYVGTNTDTIGVREAFLQNAPEACARAVGRPAMVLGAGGACRASIYALSQWLGATKVYLVNRLDNEVEDIINSFRETGFTGELVHVSTLDQAGSLQTPGLVVGCVPEFPPKTDGEILAREISTHFLERDDKGAVLEMCYHPNPRTAFLEIGENNGWETILGTEAMIWQGVAQQVLWAEKPLGHFEVDAAKAVIDTALAERRASERQ